MLKEMPYFDQGNMRLWVNENPTCVMNNIPAYCKSIDKKDAHMKSNIETLAVEASLKRHNSSYGLLGFTFTPDESQNLLEVCQQDSLINYKDTISYNKKMVCTGIRAEYASAIFDQALMCIDKYDLPKGKYVFNIGACCEFGSSKNLFKILTEMLFIIMSKNYKDISSEEVSLILKKLYIFKR